MTTKRRISINGYGSPEVLAEYFVKSVARRVNERIAKSYMELPRTDFYDTVLSDIAYNPDTISDFNRDEVAQTIATVLCPLGIEFQTDAKPKGRPSRFNLVVDGVRFSKSEFSRRYGDGNALITWNRVRILLETLKSNGMIGDYMLEELGSDNDNAS